TKKLVYWTHWEQNPEFNKFYETRGKDFAQKTGWEVQVVTVPYQGYEAKYLAALLGKSGAPDIYMGMTHHWCGQYDFCDRMPADLAKIWDENLPKYMVGVGKWKGARYGIPIEHGNFQQMYINVDLWKKAGLDPDKPVKTLDDWLAAMKKRRRTELGIFWRVVLPSVRPALATLVIVKFMWTWNELFWPLVVVNSPTIRWCPSVSSA